VSKQHEEARSGQV